MGLLHHPVQESTLGANEGMHLFVIQAQHGRFYGGIYLSNPFDEAVVLAVGARNLEAGQHVFHRVHRLAHIFFGFVESAETREKILAHFFVGLPCNT